MSKQSARMSAFYALKAVIAQKKSLRECLPAQLEQLSDARDRGLCHEIVYGTLRHYPSLLQTLAQYLRKPLKANSDIEVLLASALYQLVYLNAPDYAIVNETLNIAERTKQHKLKGLINAVLRSFLRDDNPEKVVKDAKQNHPTWLYDAIYKTYPAHATKIFTENLRAPNMTLRVRDVNLRDDYLDILNTDNIDAIAHPDVPSAILLNEKIAFTTLPEVENHRIVVQDANAQLSATLLDLHPNHTVLDACAAPGGKSVHLKDTAPSIDLTAIELNQMRAAKMKENFAELDADITVKIGDATTIEKWFKGQKFDRILLDAPCSGTGVIRKHPDILHHRRESDVKELNGIQSDLLDACFACLKEGGKLLYATCSVLEQENQAQIDAFLARTPEATLTPLTHPRAISTQKSLAGTLQFLPSEFGTGFFYALISGQS